MKKFFITLGGIFAVILGIIGVVAAIFIPRLFKLDKEATAYIEDAVPKIAAHWDSKELYNRGTLEMKSSMKTHDEGQRLFILFQQLGDLKHLNTPKGNVWSSTQTGTGLMTVGSYDAHAEFEKGSATLKIQLRRENDVWKISGFHINSDVFLPPKKS